MLGNGTGADGTYSLSVPAGKYMVQAFLPTSMGYINPDGVEVTVSPTAPGTVDLQFGQSDANITGSVYLNGAKKGSFVSAYSNNGGYSETNASGGDFTLNVTKTDIWYLKAMYESGTDFYQSPVYKVEMGGATNKSQSLTLTKASFTMPDAVSTTFDYTNAKKITLSNGFSLSIPAGAIPPTSNATGNNITITITPTGQLSTQNKSIPVGFGYEITAVDDSGSAISSNFNDNVTITIPYTEAYLNESLGSTDESLLENGYWDTTTSSWKGTNGVTVDTVNNTISFTVNHFTTFSILGAQDPTTVTSSSVSSGTSTGSTSSGGVSKPMAPKDIGTTIYGAVNKVLMLISAGTLKWDADFEVNKIDSGFKKPIPPLWIAGGPYKVVMKSWWNGAKFNDLNKPTTLILRYDPTALGNIPAKSLRINYYNEAKGKWQPLNSVLITDRNEVATVINKVHGIYVLIGGFGYQGVAEYSGKTVTAEAQSKEVGLKDSTVVDDNQIKAEPTPSVKQSSPARSEKQESGIRRFLRKILPFF